MLDGLTPRTLKLQSAHSAIKRLAEQHIAVYLILLPLLRTKTMGTPLLTQVTGMGMHVYRNYTRYAGQI